VAEPGQALQVGGVIGLEARRDTEFGGAGEQGFNPQARAVAGGLEGQERWR